jgi:hypothetical protein
VLRDTFAEVANEIGVPLIAVLSTSPGPAIKMTRDEWTSDKQYWAHIITKNWGAGIPSKRSGDVLRGWQQRTEVRSDGRDVWVFENIAPHSIWPFGKLNKDLAQAVKPQQKFHAKTGYPLAARLTNEASQQFRDVYEERIRPKNTADFVRRASVAGVRRG